MNWSKRPIYHWHSSCGIQEGKPKYADIVLGMVMKLQTGNWRMRVSRRGSGHTWKQIPESHPTVKQIKCEALIMGVPC